ncbi:MAG: ribose 5-phosphate isomerase B [Clostridia bacterium]|nr:ribose 5-phosphate isomerase B [Clostridia bacterium]
MIALGCDHGGFELKESIKKHLDNNNVEYKDFGIHTCESVDYPSIAKLVCDAVISGECEKALLFCGTGVGMSIAANKVKGIRAACCSDSFSAKYTRLHNDSNVLCLGGRVVGAGLATELVDLFINTEFEGGRHQIRVDQITKIEQEKI